MGSIVFLYLVLWLPGLVALGIGIMDYLEEKKFLKAAKETTGKIIGAVGAKLKAQNQVDLAGFATGGAMSQYSSGEYLGGAFVIVEFEDHDGDIYEIRSRQPFNELKSDTVKVQYQPENPSNAIVDGYYSGKAKYLQIYGSIIFFLAPIILHLLMMM